MSQAKRHLHFFYGYSTSRTIYELGAMQIWRLSGDRKINSNNIRDALNQTETLKKNKGLTDNDKWTNSPILVKNFKAIDIQQSNHSFLGELLVKITHAAHCYLFYCVTLKTQ